MLKDVLKKYNPKDKNSHRILRFFSEDLADDEKIKFMNLIMNEGAWVLATEISKSSSSDLLKKETEKKFYAIFNTWTEERLFYSEKISPNNRNPYLPKKYKIDFQEAIISICNLGFESNLIDLLKSYISNYNEILFKKYLDDVFWHFIADLNISTLESLFINLTKNKKGSSTSNLDEIRFKFLNKLAFSVEIFNLSSSFIEYLEDLQKILLNKKAKSYQDTITILLIHLIIYKELDLSTSSYEKIIQECIILEKEGNRDNLELFFFLKRFNYNFEEVNFIEKLNSMFDEIKERKETIVGADSHIFIMNNVQYFIRSQNYYFEKFIFLIEYIPKEEVKAFLLQFLKIIEDVKKVLASIIWFDEYDNFIPIRGKIELFDKTGFYVKIDSNYLYKKIEEKGASELANDKRFISKFTYGFLHKFLIAQSSDTKRKISKHNTKSKFKIAVPESNNLDYIISQVNYSTTNYGPVISLVPKPKELLEVISNYKMRSFFSSMDIFLINEAYSFLNQPSPFFRVGSTFSKFFSYDLLKEYTHQLEETDFWDIIKEVKPHLYEKIYLKNKADQIFMEKVEKIYLEESIVTGEIKLRTKGGFTVEVLGKEGFLPNSQVDIIPITDYDSFIGKKMNFKIIAFNKKIINFVISHKKVLEEDLTEQRELILSKLERGQIIEGRVKNLVPYGAFIDLGGIDGLIYLTDITWGRINHPEEYLKNGEQLKVVVLDYNSINKRLSLGLKQLTDNPWNLLEENNIREGSIVSGKIVNFEEYGAFLEIIPGLEGLIHHSEVSWSTDSINIKEHFILGKQYKAIVTSIDRNEWKMALSTKQLTKDPWKNIHKKYKIGETHSGKVTGVTPYGIFIELESGISGMIHEKNISFDSRKVTPKEFCEIGEVLAFRIMNIDKENRRIDLSYVHLFTKKIPKVHWESIRKKYKVGEIHSGKVIGFVPNGIFIELENGISGIIHEKYISFNFRKVTPKEFCKIGEILDFYIISIDKKNRKLNLSYIHVFIEYIK